MSNDHRNLIIYAYLWFYANKTRVILLTTYLVPQCFIDNMKHFCKFDEIVHEIGHEGSRNTQDTIKLLQIIKRKIRQSDVAIKCCERERSPLFILTKLNQIFVLYNKNDRCEQLFIIFDKISYACLPAIAMLSNQSQGVCLYLLDWLKSHDHDLGTR